MLAASQRFRQVEAATMQDRPSALMPAGQASTATTASITHKQGLTCAILLAAAAVRAFLKC
jgi:hypothetical protein